MTRTFHLLPESETFTRGAHFGLAPSVAGVNELKMRSPDMGTAPSKSLAMQTQRHPNRLLFHGVLLLVDVESDVAPHHAQGHRVILTSAAAEEALPSLIGMAVSCKADWDGHDPRLKIGVITAAWIAGNRLMVEGHIYELDFPEVEGAAATLDLGMSFDIFNVGIEDVRRKVWTLDRLTFTGAAILLRKDAAFRGTSFTIPGEGSANIQRLS